MISLSRITVSGFGTLTMYYSPVWNTGALGAWNSKQEATAAVLEVFYDPWFIGIGIPAFGVVGVLAPSPLALSSRCPSGGSCCCGMHVSPCSGFCRTRCFQHFESPYHDLGGLNITQACALGRTPESSVFAIAPESWVHNTPPSVIFPQPTRRSQRGPWRRRYVFTPAIIFLPRVHRTLSKAHHIRYMDTPELPRIYHPAKRQRGEALASCLQGVQTPNEG